MEFRCDGESKPNLLLRSNMVGLISRLSRRLGQSPIKMLPTTPSIVKEISWDFSINVKSFTKRSITVYFY